MRAMREWALIEAAGYTRSFRNTGGVEDLFKDPAEVEDAKRELGRVIYDLLKLAGIRACRTCGCDDDDACDGGCSWVGPNLCSSCTPTKPPRRRWKARRG